ncbi:MULTISPECIES: hypothetical protein [Photorhabdus]|uniref:hypothetical protein n=1 Tax=Photorhabdus TaxID=29487 RepID=UPI00058AF922|nr:MULTISPECIES: hypothetical protein [Photorhabdus]MBS9427522.1 hypothetical protein [Photorhabdus akhurstii]MBS9432478.1 hypothetical protein [Photorhabdus hainanensis]PQQ23049.1 hypothetical protein C6H69_24305 [Photorhabdus luminescens]
MEERTIYSEIKEWLLESYFMSCRDRRNSEDGWTHESIVADIYDGYTSSFNYPIEYLMLEVVALVLVGGWYPAQVEYHQEEISRLLTENKLDDLLAVVPKEEAEELLHDMNILKLI